MKLWLLFLCACGTTTSAARSQRAMSRAHRNVEETPRWMTEKNEVRLEIVKKLLEGGDSIRSLHIIQAMRAEGIKRPELDLYQGIALRQHGMTEDAERMLMVSKAAMPRNAEVYGALCVLYADSERHEQAVESCLRATELDATNAAAWNNLGFLQLNTDPELSREALRHAVDLDPTSGRYRNNLAYAQAAAGDHRAALRTFLTTGTPADAHYNVGTAFERAGNQKMALSYYERALTYDSDHVYADEALRRLRPETPSKTMAAEPSEEM